MCFRPPTTEMTSPVCPKCGHENFIGVQMCSECGTQLGSGPIGTASAESRDWTPGLEFQQNAAPTGAAPGAPTPPVPGAPPIGGAPSAPSAPSAPVTPSA